MSNLSSSTAPQLRHRVPRLAEAAVERARLTVVPRRPVRAARVPFVTLVSVILLGGVVGLLLFNTQMQQASFAATALQAQADNLAAREQTLTMEIERLRDPQAIAARATELGMVVPAAPAFLDLDTGEVVGVATPAGGDGRLRIRERAPSLPAVLDPAPEVAQGEAPPEGVLPQGDQTGTAAGTRGDGGRGSSSADTDRRDRGNSDRRGTTSQESQENRQNRQSQARRR